jgi:uncharacterized protein YndB with AHSA1/START domain
MSDEICGVNPAPERGLQSTTTVPAPRARVWRALTDAGELRQWLAEARVDLPGGVYELWGPWTPQAPDAPLTKLHAYEEGTSLSFSWPMYGVETFVTLTLADTDKGTEVVSRHQGIVHSDLWVNVLENLRTFCLGGSPRPYDFTSAQPGDLRISIDIAAEPARVFQALLDPATLDKFWASGASYDAAAGTLDYGWGTPPLQILDLQPGQRLSVAWWEDEKHPETVVTWELEGSGGGTRITLTHTGFADGVEHDGLDIGWYGFLLSLRAILELGDQWSKVEPKSFTAEPVAE